ncbi:MAG: allophanate hydrolase [Solirubrobacteraceae bacterium]|nr:allophanate hydrolase [Solirubrobacteraceae bacterium]
MGGGRLAVIGSIADLLADYRAGHSRPSEVAGEVLDRLGEDPGPAWITLVDPHALRAAARSLDAADPGLPLYGIPFAVKDNIDVGGLPTTAACPGFAREADRDAAVVERLLGAGALLVGKTNMDQFATGLVGTRSPYGTPACVFDGERVPGGSSSGSGVAVALGHVMFALGTDTAGSGRVPAAFNELVGIKPTRGLVSNRGVLPACRGLDCVSVLARSVADAAAVLAVAAAFDPADAWSRAPRVPTSPRHGRVAVPLDGQLIFQEADAAAAWEQACREAAATWELVRVDIGALLEAADLLYDVWVSERTADLGDIVAAEPDGLDPTVAAIVRAGAGLRAVDVFAGQHRLAELHRAACPIWEQADALLLPTTPGHPRLDEVAADPVGVNARLGRFTNFVNLLDLAAIAVPGPRRPDGLPGGVSLIAPAFHDHRLMSLAAEWRGEPRPASSGATRLVVVGAHMSGLPLNGELTSRGARLVRRARTAPVYRLFALPGAGVPRPGLVRTIHGGAAVEAEVWELAPAAVGELLEGVPAPLGIGRVTLEDGEDAAGFVCEGYATHGAIDVTSHGGWRAYLDAADMERP